jgi:hypothetical protein
VRHVEQPFENQSALHEKPPVKSFTFFSKQHWMDFESLFMMRAPNL